MSDTNTLVSTPVKKTQAQITAEAQSKAFNNKITAVMGIHPGTGEHFNDISLAKKLLLVSLSAKKRGIPFDLSLKRLKQLLKQKTCYFTGEVFSVTDENLRRSIDRVNNDLGYIDSNVVVCTKAFNNIKGNLTLKQIQMLVKGVNKHQKKLNPKLVKRKPKVAQLRKIA